MCVLQQLHKAMFLEDCSRHLLCSFWPMLLRIEAGGAHCATQCNYVDRPHCSVQGHTDIKPPSDIVCAHSKGLKGRGNILPRIMVSS